MTRSAPSTVDEYVAAVGPIEMRHALETLRAIIRDELPEAQECISYRMPTYKQHGMVAGFAAFARHCSFFPGGIVEMFAEELSGFKTSKGTVQFTPEHPIPEPLVRRMLRESLQRNLARRGLAPPER